MRSTRRTIGVSALVAIGALLLTSHASAVGDGLETGRSIGFVINQDQLDARVAYHTSDLPWTVFFTPDAVAALSGPRGGDAGARPWAVRIQLTEGSPDVTISGDGRRSERLHFYLGDEPASWRTNVPSFDRITYHNVRPGTDLVFRVDGSALAYTLVTSDARPGGFRFGYLGAERSTARETHFSRARFSAALGMTTCGG
jgi:hypothetical protein